MARTREDDRVRALLKDVPLLADCTPKELAAIASAGKWVEHGANDVIAREGEGAVGLHMILEGEVRVEIEGRSRGKLGPGGYFGEIALLDKGPRTATVVTETPAVTFVIPSWNFRDVLRSQPGVALKMLEGLAGRFRRQSAAFADCSRLSDT